MSDLFDRLQPKVGAAVGSMHPGSTIGTMSPYAYQMGKEEAAKNPEFRAEYGMYYSDMPQERVQFYAQNPDFWQKVGQYNTNLDVVKWVSEAASASRKRQAEYEAEQVALTKMSGGDRWLNMVGSTRVPVKLTLPKAGIYPVGQEEFEEIEAAIKDGNIYLGSKQIGILDDDGNILPTNEAGEVQHPQSWRSRILTPTNQTIETAAATAPLEAFGWRDKLESIQPGAGAALEQGIAANFAKFQAGGSKTGEVFEPSGVGYDFTPQPEQDRPILMQYPDNWEKMLPHEQVKWKIENYPLTALAFEAGVGDVQQSFQGVLYYMGAEDTARAMQYGISQRHALAENVPTQTTTSRNPVTVMQDVGFWYDMVRSLPFQLLLMPLTFVGGFGAGSIAAKVIPKFLASRIGVAMAAKFGAKMVSRVVAHTIQVGVQSGTSALAEGTLEAGNAYNVAISLGMSREEAKAVFEKTLIQNIGLLSSTNSLEFALAFMPVSGAKGVLRNVSLGVLSEGAEEVLQEVVQRSALGQPIAWDANMAAQAYAGAVMGGVFTGGGQLFSRIQNNIVSALPTALNVVYEKTYNEAKGTHEQKRAAGIEAVAKASPEGAELVERVTKESVQEAKQETDAAVQKRAREAKKNPKKKVTPKKPVATSAPAEAAPVAKPVAAKAKKAGKAVSTNKLQETIERWENAEQKKPGSLLNDVEHLGRLGYDVSAVETAIEDFTMIARGDYDSIEDWQEAREDAWSDIISALTEVEELEVTAPAEKQKAEPIVKSAKPTTKVPKAKAKAKKKPKATLAKALEETKEEQKRAFGEVFTELNQPTQNVLNLTEAEILDAQVARQMSDQYKAIEKDVTPMFKAGNSVQRLLWSTLGWDSAEAAEAQLKEAEAAVSAEMPKGSQEHIAKKRAEFDKLKQRIEEAEKLSDPKVKEDVMDSEVEAVILDVWDRLDEDARLAILKNYPSVKETETKLSWVEFKKRHPQIAKKIVDTLKAIEDVAATEAIDEDNAPLIKKERKPRKKKATAEPKVEEPAVEEAAEEVEIVEPSDSKEHPLISWISENDSIIKLTPEDEKYQFAKDSGGSYYDVTEDKVYVTEALNEKTTYDIGLWLAHPVIETYGLTDIAYKNEGDEAGRTGRRIRNHFIREYNKDMKRLGDAGRSASNIVFADVFSRVSRGIKPENYGKTAISIKNKFFRSAPLLVDQRILEMKGDPLFKQLMIAASKLEEAKPQNELILSKFRSDQLKAGIRNFYKAGMGMRGYHSLKKGLQGKIDYPVNEEIAGLFTEEQLNKLVNYIWSFNGKNYLPFTKLHAIEAIDTYILRGIVPPRSYVAALEMFFGRTLSEELIKHYSLQEKSKYILYNIVNFARSNQASFDFSAWMRQLMKINLDLAIPIGWEKNDQINLRQEARALLKKAVQETWVAFTEGHEMTIEIARELSMNNLYDFATRMMGLDITQPTGFSMVEEVGKAEESFQSAFAVEHLPWIKKSEDVYVTPMNIIRMGYFEMYFRYFEGGTFVVNADNIKALKAPGGVQFYKQLATLINWSTGRSSMGKLSNLAPVLNAMFFAPKFAWANISFMFRGAYTFTNPAVRKIYARQVAKFLITMGSMVALAALIPGVEVEKDPLSSSFGTIRIGNTRIDPWAGHKQYLTFLASFASQVSGDGIQKKAADGTLYRMSGFEIGERLIRSKLNPIMALIYDSMKKETFLGEPVFPKDKGELTLAVLQRTAPLFVNDVIEALRTDGLWGGARTAPAILGIGVTTYRNKIDIRNDNMYLLPDELLMSYQEAIKMSGEQLTYQDLNELQQGYLNRELEKLGLMPKKVEGEVREDNISAYFSQLEENREEYEAGVEDLMAGLMAGDIPIEEYFAQKDALYTSLLGYDKREAIQTHIKKTNQIDYENLMVWLADTDKPEDKVYDEYRTIRATIPVLPSKQPGVKGTAKDWDKWRENITDFFNRQSPENQNYILLRQQDFINYIDDPIQQELERLNLQFETNPDFDRYYNITGKNAARDKHIMRANNPDMDVALNFLGRATTFASDAAYSQALSLVNGLGMPKDAMPGLLSGVRYVSPKTASQVEYEAFQSDIEEVRKLLQEQ